MNAITVNNNMYGSGGRHDVFLKSGLLTSVCHLRFDDLEQNFDSLTSTAYR